MLFIVIFYRVCGDYITLLVTFFVAYQIVLQNISRTKILIADRASLRVVLVAHGYYFTCPWQLDKRQCRTRINNCYYC